MKTNRKINLKNKKGFTIVELMVSLAIFGIMTALVLSKYGNFNQGVLLTNLAYDVALSIRNAQSYGLNVKSASRTSNDFSGIYGVYFNKTNNTEFIFFADLNDNGAYDGGTEKLSITNIKRGSKIYDLCMPISTCNQGTLNVTFKRPDPNAIINGNTSNNSAKIILESSDGGKKEVEVRSTGQISVI